MSRPIEPTIQHQDCFGRWQWAYYTAPGQTFPSERHQLPLLTCEICGAVVNDTPAAQALHVEWHKMWGVRP